MPHDRIWLTGGNENTLNRSSNDIRGETLNTFCLEQVNLWVGPWVEGSASTLDLSASAKRLIQQLVFFQNQDFKKGSRDPYRLSFFRLLFRFLGHILSMFNILHYKPYHPLFIVILILISQQQLVLQGGQVIDLPICLQLLHILRSKWPGWDWWSTGTHPKTVCFLYMKINNWLQYQSPPQ